MLKLVVHHVTSRF